MKSSVKRLFGCCLVVPAGSLSSVAILHVGIMFSSIDLVPLIIAALAGGFFVGCFIRHIVRDRKAPYQASWYFPLAGAVSALLPMMFIVCTLSLHDEFPRHSFLNELFDRYHDRLSPLHKQPEQQISEHEGHEEILLSDNRFRSFYGIK
ncbi:MAG: hypothetical protein ACL93V_08850 [Candidatus Electrothrix sp. YB6]